MESMEQIVPLPRMGGNIKNNILVGLMAGLFFCVFQNASAVAAYDSPQASDKSPTIPDPAGLQRVDTPLQDRLALKHARSLAIVKNLRNRIHFNISQSMEYDDNIFATGSNQDNGCDSGSSRSNDHSNGNGCPKESDVIATTNLAVGFDVIRIDRGKRLLEDFALGVEYMMNYQVFMSHPEETRLRQFVAPTLTAPLAWVSGDGKFVLTVREDLRPEVNYGDDFGDPASDLERNGSAVNDRNIYYSIQHDFDAHLVYRESERANVGWRYHNSATIYTSDEVNNLNYIRNSTGPTTHYLLGPRTDLFGLGDVSWTNYIKNNSDGTNNNSDYVEYRVEGGVRRRLAAKTNASFSAGYKWHVGRDGGDRSNGPIFRATYDQVISPRTRYGLYANHEISTRRDQAFRTRTLEELANADNEVVTTTTFGGRFIHFLGPKLSLATDSGISIEKDTGGDGGNNNDIFFHVRTILRYYFTHHWTGDLAHVFTTEQGGDDGFNGGGDGDYVRNRYIATIRYQF